MDGAAGLPRRTRVTRKTAVDRVLGKKQCPQESACVKRNEALGARVVPLSRHDDTQQRIPCLLSESFKNSLSAKALLRITSKLQPDLRFYARAHDNFSAAIKGVSLLREIADQAKIADREVEVLEVDEHEATLEEAVVVIGDRYLSKRDIWHMHLTTIQGGGQFLWSHYDNFKQQCPGSWVERLILRPGGSVLSGVVTTDTQLTFKSPCANMFLLLQVSAELWNYGLEGRPYWQLLIECFINLVERSFRVKGDCVGHYVRMVMFCRTKRHFTVNKHPPSENVIGKIVSPSADVLFEIGSHQRALTVGDLKAVIEKETGIPAGDQDMLLKGKELNESDQPFATASSSSLVYLLCQGQWAFEDFYDVVWEGHAKAMPPVQRLVSGIRQNLICLNEQLVDTSVCPELYVSPRPQTTSTHRDWSGVSATDIVEASKGNIFECLNLALDHFDQHHLDRHLRVTGQRIVLLTAGSGLIHANSKDLYELTAKRISIGPRFSMVLVREPPLHVVPLVHCSWTESPDKPDWIEVSYCREISFCPCLPNTTWMNASFLSLERVNHNAPSLFVASWSDDEMSLNACADAPPPSGLAAGTTTKWAEGVGRPRVQGFGDMRLLPLRSHFNRTPDKRIAPGHGKRAWWTEYTLESKRFDGCADVERSMLMHDLIGLRLSVVTATEIHEASQQEILDTHKANLKSSLSAAGPDAYLNGALIPEALHCVTVSSTNGIQWTLEDRDTGVHIRPIKYEIVQKDTGATYSVEQRYRYKSFNVRRSFSSSLQAINGEVTDEQGGSCDGFITGRKVFHHQHLNTWEWNILDAVICGNLPIPPALPYPVQGESSACESGSIVDRCPGWKLRSAVKIHFYMLVPIAAAERSQEEHVACALNKLDGKIKIGVDPFEAAQGSFANDCSDAVRESRQNCIRNFEAFRQAFEELCYGRSTSASRADRESLRRIDTSGKSYTLRQAKSTVYVRNMNIASAFPNSRDWFEMFYDNAYSPPKVFHLVLQWIVCSSVHQFNFLVKMHRLAEDHGFLFVQIPTTQLFPQPAPSWIWSPDDQETNFDRLPFYPRRKIELKFVEGGDCCREKLFAELLRCWLRPPLNFFIVFSSPIPDFKVVADHWADKSVNDSIDSIDSAKSSQAQIQLFNRLKGWVLCEKECLCIIALREDNIYWYDSWLVYCHSREPRKTHSNLERMEVLWREFRTATEDILKQVAEIDWARATSGRAHDWRIGRPDAAACSPMVKSTKLTPKKEMPPLLLED